MITAVPRRVSSPVFVGRIAELAALAEALRRAANGEPGIVLITGEAGIGKSRLLAEARRLSAEIGVSAVGGNCVDVAVGTLAYAPFVDIVRELHADGLTASLAAAPRHELGRLVPETATGLDESPRAGKSAQGEQGGQGRLFAAVRDLLAGAASSAPLLVTIEDLHWADTSTLDLFTYLARSLQHERYVLAATARLDTLPRRHPLVGVAAELARLPWFERVDLARFDAAEVVTQLTGILGREPDPEMARGVFERSDGNAFFAEELVAAGDLRGGPLPASLRGVLAARLAALDDVTQDVVRVAAVAGRIVSHDLLEQVAGKPSSVLVSALREAVDQRVLTHIDDPAPGYAFRHALLREAASDELLMTERIAIHRAIADALERGGISMPLGELARTGELAYHALAAQDLPRALNASLAAVAIGEQASAHAEVEVHLDRIVELWTRVPDASARVGTDHAGLLARAARAAASAGHQSRAVALARDALAELGASDAERRIAALLELFDYAWEAADIETADRVVLEVTPMLRGERSARSARAFAAEALLHWHQGRNTSAREAALRAIAIARECGARQELARALMILAQAYTHLGETNHAEESFAEAAGILEESSDPDVRARSTWWRSWAMYIHGRFVESLAIVRAGLEIARREGSDGRYGVNLLEMVHENLIELGRWSEARATGEQILGRLTFSFEQIYTRSSLARLHTYVGRIAEAERELATASEIAAVGPHRVWQLSEAIFLAYATGRYADGRLMMESALDASPEPGRDATLWWPLVKAIEGEADRAEAARRRRRGVEAEQAVAAGHRFADVFRQSASAAIDADGAGPMVMVDLLSVAAEERRLDGHPDPARWAAAIEARNDIEQPRELAYARYRLAEALLVSGAPAASAAIPLREAYSVASALGAAPLRIAMEGLASRARIQLDSTDDGVPSAEPAATALTARELAVLALVADGHTNREIGARLFISEKTASVHVTHAMAKLGALSRYEAAAAAHRLGLLDSAVSEAAGSDRWP